MLLAAFTAGFLCCLASLQLIAIINAFRHIRRNRPGGFRATCKEKYHA